MPNAPRQFSLRPASPGTPRPRRVDTRESSSARGYDSTWTEFRRLELPKHRTCEHCRHYDGRVVPTHELDHIVPIEEPADPLRLDVENVRGLCRRHHARKTARFDRRVRAYYEALLGKGLSQEKARHVTVALFRFPAETARRK